MDTIMYATSKTKDTLNVIRVFSTNIGAQRNTKKRTHLQSCRASWSIEEFQLTKREEEESWGVVCGINDR